MSSLCELYRHAAAVSSELVTCRGCTKCCESGLVYVREEEAESLRALGVPIVELDGVLFIESRADGSCPMLDRERKCCSIYEDRPLCCRLFPIDILKLNGKMSWAVSSQCPPERRAFSCIDEPEGTLGYGSIGTIVKTLEDRFGREDRAFFTEKEVAGEGTDLLERDLDNWVGVAQFHCGGVDGEGEGQERQEGEAGATEG